MVIAIPSEMIVVYSVVIVRMMYERPICRVYTEYSGEHRQENSRVFRIKVLWTRTVASLDFQRREKNVHIQQLLTQLSIGVYDLMSPIILHFFSSALHKNKRKCCRGCYNKNSSQCPPRGKSTSKEAKKSSLRPLMSSCQPCQW